MSVTDNNININLKPVSMAQLKLKVKKAGSKNPVSKQMGFVARVLTNGTADFDDIVKEAGMRRL